MSVIAWAILGAVAASVLWMFAIAWLLDVIGAQRKALNSALTTVQFYRDTREESDRQVRDLLGQNERLARLLIEAKISTTATNTLPVPASFFQPGVES